MALAVLVLGAALFGFLKKLSNPDLNPNLAPAR
jgi:hypothetical protein